MRGDSKDDKRQRGVSASSADFTRYDQVQKPDYQLSESADGAEVFDDDFEFATCDLGRFLHGDAGDASLMQMLVQASGWTAVDDVEFICVDAPHACAQPQSRLCG